VRWRLEIPSRTDRRPEDERARRGDRLTDDPQQN